MQSMNHSLLALLVHNEITYREAMDQSPDPEDLSLKLRKMFPNLETQGEEMATSDFAEIQELQQFRKLYEEQEIKTKERLAERDEQAGLLQQTIDDRDQEIRDLHTRMEEMKQEVDRMKGEYGRLREEAQQKMDKLMDRIRELNQRLAGGAGADKKSGIFR
jgi:chromosome segregation ATPase